MSEIDAVDEAIIDADPETVAKALMDEIEGKTHWWQPSLKTEPHGSILPTEEGGMFDVIVHGGGGPIRWTNKTIQVTENMMRAEMVDGAFKGEGTWTFEPIDGKTLVRYHWRAQPNSWALKLVAPFINLEQSHHQLMIAGLEGLKRYVKQRKLGHA